MKITIFDESNFITEEFDEETLRAYSLGFELVIDSLKSTASKLRAQSEKEIKYLQSFFSKDFVVTPYEKAFETVSDLIFAFQKKLDQFRKMYKLTTPQSI